MRVLVTGARGFIGSVILKKLREKGVYAFELEGDIRAPLPAADIIVHCAGRKNDEPDSYEVNVGGAKNVLASGAKIINISTVAATLARKGLYGRTKAEAEEVLQDQVTLRLGLVYGDGGILKTLINWTRLPVVPVYGRAVFHPIYVEDVADIVVQALTWPKGICQIGGPDGVTLAELAKLVAKVFHQKKVVPVYLPRFLARFQLTESNILGAEQTVEFDKPYGRSLTQGLKDVCNQMSQ
jgi:nucleoside-diphosphate-sugar epimerase